MKIAQKEIDNESDQFDDTIIEFSEEKLINRNSGGYGDEDSDGTTAAGITTMNNLLSNMVINPRKKLEIDHSQDLLNKWENITIGDDEIRDEEEGPSKNINFFSKTSVKVSQDKTVDTFTRYNLNSTVWREPAGEHKIIVDRKFMDFPFLLHLKRNTISSIIFNNRRKAYSLQKELIKIMRDFQKFYVFLPAWKIIFDIIYLMETNETIHSGLKEIILTIEQTGMDNINIDNWENFSKPNLEWLMSQLQNAINLWESKTNKVKGKELTKSSELLKRRQVWKYIIIKIGLFDTK